MNYATHREQKVHLHKKRMKRFYSRRHAAQPKVFKRKSRRSRLGSGTAKNTVGSHYNVLSGSLRPFVDRNPFPPGQRITTSYAEPFVMTTGVAAFGTNQVMRLNSIYDPNYTGGGHLAYAHANLAALYGKYRVDSVYWRITLTTPGATNDQYIAANIAPNTSGAITGAPLYNPIEDPACTVGIMSGNGERRAVISGLVELWKLMGVSKQKYMSDDTYQSSISSNPAQLALLSFATCCADGTSGVTSQALVELRFNVWVFDRITVN